VAPLQAASRDHSIFVLLGRFLVLPQIATLLTQTNRAFRAQDIAGRDLSLKDSLGSASYTTRHQKIAPPSLNNPFCILLFLVLSLLSPFHRAIRCLSLETPPSLSTLDAVIPNRIKPPQ
jgi:hypothetical protein